MLADLLYIKRKHHAIRISWTSLGALWKRFCGNPRGANGPFPIVLPCYPVDQLYDAFPNLGEPPSPWGHSRNFLKKISATGGLGKIAKPASVLFWVTRRLEPPPIILGLFATRTPEWRPPRIKSKKNGCVSRLSFSDDWSRIFRSK